MTSPSASKRPTLGPRLMLVAVAIAASLLALPATASADFLGIQLRGSMEVTSHTCDVTGVSTIMFTASGESLLSYPGTFVAIGSFTLGPQNLPGYTANNFLPAGALLSWSENVTIDSPGGEVTLVSDRIAEPPPGFEIPGATMNTGTCTFVENATLGSVQNATGTVISTVGAVSVRSAGAGLPFDAFASSVAAEMSIESSSVGGFTAGSFDQTLFSGAVVSAEQQLSDLGAAVEVAGPGTSLASKLGEAQTALSADDVRRTCLLLRAFINQVSALSGKSIPDETATSLIADATRIAGGLGC